MIRPFLCTIAAACMICGASTVRAQSGTGDPIRLVVPFDAGGGTDVVARVIAQAMSAELKRNIVVLNRGGAGTRIGSEFVAKSLPDGLTLLYSGIGLTFHPAIYKDLPYDLRRDFVAVAMVGRQPYLLATGTSMGNRTLAEIIALARQKPDTLTYGSAGIGSGTHIASEILWGTLGIKLNHVPYKGTAPALIDLLGGRLDLVYSTIASLASRAKAGQLHAIGISTAKRNPLLPDVPTIAEQGFPGFEYVTWAAIFARTGTPAATQNAIADAVAKAVALPQVRASLESDGFVPAPAGPEEAQRYFLSEVERWPPLILRAGIQPQ